MSYGVVASKSAQLMLPPLPGRPAGAVRWVTGRVSLTRLKLTFVASQSGVPLRVEVPLRDVSTVTITEGRVRRSVGVRTADREVVLRVASAGSFAQEVASAVEALRRPAATVEAETQARSTRGDALRPRTPREGAVHRPTRRSTLALR